MEREILSNFHVKTLLLIGCGNYPTQNAPWSNQQQTKLQIINQRTNNPGSEKMPTFQRSQAGPQCPAPGTVNLGHGVREDCGLDC